MLNPGSRFTKILIAIDSTDYNKIPISPPAVCTAGWTTAFHIRQQVQPM